MNAHYLIVQCLEYKDFYLLDKILNLDVLVPEILARLHDILFCAAQQRLPANHAILNHVTRYNTHHHIIHESVFQRLQEGSYSEVRESLRVVQEKVRNAKIEQDIVTIMESGRWTPAFLSLLCIYFGKSFHLWGGYYETTSVFFKTATRAIIHYFQSASHMKLVQSPNDISPRDILAICLSRPTKEPIIYFPSEEESPSNDTEVKQEDMDVAEAKESEIAGTKRSVASPIETQLEKKAKSARSFAAKRKKPEDVSPDLTHRKVHETGSV